MATQIIRTIIMYTFVILAVRIMGKRQLSELTPTELVVTLLISELASLPMQDIGIPMLHGIIPIAILISIEIALSHGALKSNKFRELLTGKPVPVVENGKIHQKNLKSLRQTAEDLLEELRMKDAFDLSSVIFAQVETNGRLSVLVAPKQNSAPESYARIIVSDGRLIKEALLESGHDEPWLRQTLASHNVKDIADCFLLMVDAQQKITFLPKERNQ